MAAEPRRLAPWTLAVLAGLAACGSPPEQDTSGPPMEVRVDPRVELLSVLFRMGGREEYDMTRVADWAGAVDGWFEEYAEHPAVVMTARLAGPYDVGFFVPMNLAVHLEPPPDLAPRSDLASVESIHRTWTTFPDTTEQFLRLVRDFARDTRFADFLQAHAELVDTAEARMRRLVDETVARDWFDAFWGVEAAATFVLVPGLTTGRASYGVEYDDGSGTRELHAIVGVMDTDPRGLPTFGEGVTASVVHELNHPYVDGLLEAHLPAMAEAVDTLFATHAEVLRRQAVGSGTTLLVESLVRAAVARYRGDREGAAALEAEVAEQVELGFAWMPGLVALLGEYEDRRDDYPTMAAFMPRIADFFAAVAG